MKYSVLIPEVCLLYSIGLRFLVMMTKKDHMIILEQKILEEVQVTGLLLSYICSL